MLHPFVLSASFALNARQLRNLSMWTEGPWARTECTWIWWRPFWFERITSFRCAISDRCAFSLVVFFSSSLSYVTIAASPDGLNVVLDSVDTLCSDMGSVSQTYNFIRELFAIVRNRASECLCPKTWSLFQNVYISTEPSSLILHITSPSPLIPLLSSCTLSSPLVHLIAHPPALITHLATSYLTLPPPASPPAKFWAIFIPLSERGYESDRLVFGPGGEGCGDAGTGEFAVEILLRGGDDGLGGRRKGVERVLEGWSGNGPCELTELQILKGIWTRKSVDEVCMVFS